MMNLKLGMKIGLGFAMLIVIAAVLGLMAVLNMTRVQQQAIKLQEEDVPALKFAGEFERANQQAFLNNRIYTLTEDEGALKKGRGLMDKADKHLAEARQVAEGHGLAKLKEAISQTTARFDEYKGLMEETVTAMTALKQDRSKMIEAAEWLEKSYESFRGEQFEGVSRDFADKASPERVLERVRRIKLIEGLANEVDDIRRAIWKGQALRDVSVVEKALANFDKVDSNLAELKPITRAQSDLQILDQIQTASSSYKASMQRLVATMKSLDDLGRRRLVGSEELSKAVQTMAQVSFDDTKASTDNSVATLASAETVLIIGLVAAAVLGILVAVMLTRAITRPIIQGVELAKSMAGGDFTKGLDSRQQDEIGDLVRALNSMREHLAVMFKDIGVGVQTLSSSSSDLSSISSQMSSSSEQTSSKANMVATAAEEMSSNMTSVAAAMEQASTNIHTVATATEQMTATIGEIAKSSEKARSITGEAVVQATTVNGRVSDLGRAAREIGKVTEAISAISAQTNLLALNATIEAARAGEAGKGFAVVANEIKELAQQTAHATEDIKNKIESIQSSTSLTVTDIEKISKVIQEVNDIVSTIAAAIEEQSVATRDIATNVGQASQGIQEVTENVSQSSTVAGSIAQDIGEVNQAAGEISSSSSQVRLSAQDLAKLSDRLKEMVGRFRI